MTRRPTPHDFLLDLRGRRPFLARCFDGVRALGFNGRTLEIRSPRGSWAEGELGSRRGELLEAVRGFFGPEVDVVLEASPEDPEGLPFPVLASKVWNHVAFWVAGNRESAVLAVRKPLYLESWLPRAGAGEEIVLGGEVFRKRYAEPLRLPNLVDDLCELGRAQASYVQLVTPFPGDEAADRTEGALYGVKEWGTPQSPAAVLQKYVGRIHYVSPRNPPLGIRLVRRELESRP